MTDSVKSNDDDDDVAGGDVQPGEAGDVEAAGETTAASAINGPADTRPVGADTMIKVSDREGQKE
jgi:hypothetical protein